MRRRRKWLLPLALLLIAANVLGGFLGWSSVILMLDVIIVGIGGLVVIYWGIKASERARLGTKK